MPDPSNTFQQRLIEQVLALMRGGDGGRNNGHNDGHNDGREAACRMLYQGMGHSIQRFLERHGLSSADAEEIMNDTILKFITSDPASIEPTFALAWLWQIANNEFKSRYRHHHAQKRGGKEGGSQTETTQTPEEWQQIENQLHAPLALPDWVIDCIGRATAFFQSERPPLFEVLRLIVQGYSNREIAIIYGADPENVSSEQENAAKSRVHHARTVAQSYFEECKE